MREAGPTQGAERQADKVARWTARPRLSQFVRFTIIATPVILSVLFTIFMGRAFPPEELGMGRWTWVAAVFIMANLLLFVLGRLARRLTPLVGLMKLTLVFPDHAPSRSKALLRQSNSRSMLRAIDAAKLRGDDSDKTLHSDYLVQLLSDINKHDRLTRGHSERVRAYAELLGEELGLNDEDMDKLRWSALLHDVGKLSVRPEILNKDGRPTDEEWAELQGHPAAAMEYLEPLKPWLGEWVHSADQHHCRWDGDGYPSDLAGTDISLAGRIVAIADAYDVMTSARSYKKPLSAELARQELTDCAGRQFDPTLVRAFLHVGLGELKAVAGPWAWLANLTGSAQLPVPITSAVTGAAWTAAVATVGFVAAGSAVPTETEGPFAFVPPPVVDVVESTTTTEPPVTTTVVPSSAGPTTVAPTTTIATTTSTSTTAAPTTTTVAPASVTTLPPNRPPSIAAAERTIDEDTPLGGIVLSATITDPEGQAVSASIVGGDPEGSFALSSSGVITVAKLLDFEAISEYPLVISATDGQASTNKVVVITIADVDEKPTATGSLLATWEDSSDRVDLTTKVSDPEGGTLTWNIPATTENGGTLTERDGVVSYTPALNFTGSDRFSYTVSDAAGNTSTPASVSLVVYATNDAPVGYNDSFTTAEDTSFVTGDATANDVDVDDGLDVTTTAIQMMPLNGIAVSNGDGTFTYAPDANFNGVDSFTYTVRDTEGLSTSPATVTITVNSVNDTPLAANDAVTTAEDAAIITGDVTANDTDIDDGLDITTITIDTPATNGTAASNGDGTFTYTPNADYNGVDTFTYTIADNTGTPSAPATVTITIISENDLPTAVDDTLTIDHNTSGNIDPRTNDSDPDGLPLTVVAVSTPSNGTAVIEANGTVTYTHNGSKVFTDSFTYDIEDADGAPATATIDITITPPPDADAIAAAFDNCPYHFNPMQFDTDGDGAGDVCDPFPTVTSTGAFTGTGQLIGEGNDRTFSLDVGDVDLDGDLDLVFGVRSDGTTVWLNDGTGTFINTGQSLGSGDVDAVVLADLDGDGDPGMIIANKTGGNTIWGNDGTGTYINTGQSLGNADTAAIAVGDVDLDGDLDVIFGNIGAANTLWLNDGNGFFTDSGQNLGNNDGLGVAVGDFDNDGDLDLAFAHLNEDNTILLNNGSGVFTNSGQALGSSESHDVAAADLDGDGDLDLVFAEDKDFDTVWLNDGFGVFTDTQQSLGLGHSHAVSLGDVDGDGDIDIFFGDHISFNTVFINDGSASFTTFFQAPGEEKTEDIILGDLNGDGRLDGATANDNEEASIWLNN